MTYIIKHLYDFRPDLSGKRQVDLYLPFPPLLTNTPPCSDALEATRCKPEWQNNRNQPLYEMLQAIIQRLDDLSDTVELLKENRHPSPALTKSNVSETFKKKHPFSSPITCEAPELNDTIYALKESIGSLNHQLQKMYASRSWRYTFLCRKIAHFYRQKIKPLLFLIGRYFLLDRLIKKNLFASTGRKITVYKVESPLSSGYHDLSLRSAKIYAALLSYSAKRNR